MIRIALAIALAFSFVSLTTTSTAADKKEKAGAKTLEGKLVCTKCTLNESKACGHALQVKEGDKTVTYYIKDKGGKEKYHSKVCPGGTELDAKVTGKVSVNKKTKKHTITGAKVELK